jgi:hypothetical protein
MDELKSILDLVTYPAKCACGIGNWLAFLVVIMIASFLWASVVADIE